MDPGERGARNLRPRHPRLRELLPAVREGLGSSIIELYLSLSLSIYLCIYIYIYI